MNKGFCNLISLNLYLSISWKFETKVLLSSHSKYFRIMHADNYLNSPCRHCTWMWENIQVLKCYSVQFSLACGKEEISTFERILQPTNEERSSVSPRQWRHMSLPWTDPPLNHKHTISYMKNSSTSYTTLKDMHLTILQYNCLRHCFSYKILYENKPQISQLIVVTIKIYSSNISIKNLKHNWNASLINFIHHIYIIRKTHYINKADFWNIFTTHHEKGTWYIHTLYRQLNFICTFYMKLGNFESRFTLKTPLQVMGVDTTRFIQETMKIELNKIHSAQ